MILHGTLLKVDRYDAIFSFDSDDERKKYVGIVGGIHSATSEHLRHLHPLQDEGRGFKTVYHKSRLGTMGVKSGNSLGKIVNMTDLIGKECIVHCTMKKFAFKTEKGVQIFGFKFVMDWLKAIE